LPSNGGGDGSLVFERSIPALVSYAVGDDFVDVTVGADEGGESDGCDKGLHNCEVGMRLGERGRWCGVLEVYSLNQGLGKDYIVLLRGREVVFAA
jgi:hypothetical protein